MKHSGVFVPTDVGTCDEIEHHACPHCAAPAGAACRVHPVHGDLLHLSRAAIGDRAIRQRRRAAFLSGLVDGMALGPLRRRFAHATLLWLTNRCLRPFGVAVGHLVEGDGRGPGVLWTGRHVRGSWGLARRQPDGTWRMPPHLGGEG